LVRRRATAKAFGKPLCVTDFVGAAYGQVYEMPHKGAPRAVSGPLVPTLEMEEGADAGALDNRAIKERSGAQTVSHQAIEALKAAGASGADIVEQVARGSRTFGSKTEHSRAKWLRGKKGRWLRRFQLLPASAYDVAAAHHARAEHSEREGECPVRSDSLAMALSLADVRSGQSVLVADGAGGGVAAAAWRRMGRRGRMVLPHAGARPSMTSLDVVGDEDVSRVDGSEARGGVLAWRRHPDMAVVRWAELAEAAPDGRLVQAEEVKEEEAGAEAGAEAEAVTAGKRSREEEGEGSGEAAGGGRGAKRPRPESAPPAAADDDADTQAGDASATGRDGGAPPSGAAPSSEPRVAPSSAPSPSQLRSWLASGLDAAVIALPTDPLEPCLLAARLLRPGACLAALCLHEAPLARAAAALRDSGMCRDVQLRTLFRRTIQVQPHATRPEMLMHAAPGWVLSAQVVLHPYSAVRPTNRDVEEHFAPRHDLPSTAPVVVDVPAPAAPVMAEEDATPTAEA